MNGKTAALVCFSTVEDFPQTSRAANTKREPRHTTKEGAEWKKKNDRKNQNCIHSPKAANSTGKRWAKEQGKKDNVGEVVDTDVAVLGGGEQHDSREAYTHLPLLLRGVASFQCVCNA